MKRTFLIFLLYSLCSLLLIASVTYEIQGFVRTLNGLNIEDVIMEGLPQNPKTGPNGSYSARVEHGWSGTVTPVKSGYIFEPVSKDYDTVRENIYTDNYLARPVRYVNKKATGLPVNGRSWNNAYRTIKDALNNAESGYIIRVSDHEYEENNLEVKDNVSLIGGFRVGDSDPSTITPLSGSNNTGNPTLIIGDYSEVQNFKISNSATGIRAHQVMHFTISNSHFDNNSTAISLMDTHRKYHQFFEPGIIIDNEFTLNGYGIRGFNDFSFIEKNTFSDNKHYSVYMSGNSKSWIYDNTFEDEPISILSEKSETRIYENEFNNIANIAIKLLSSDISHVYDNAITNSYTAVKLNQFKGNVFSNTIENNDYGIYSYNFSSGYVGENNIFGNNSVAVLTKDSSLKVFGNEFNDSDITFKFHESNNRVFSNRIINSLIQVGEIDKGENSIYNNLILDNEKLFEVDGASVTFFNNTLVNYTDGIYFKKLDSRTPGHVYNNIFWPGTNVDNIVEIDPPLNLTVSHNMFQFPDPYQDSPPIEENPALTSPFRAGDNYRLHKESNAIDAGLDNMRLNFTMLKDKDGNCRWQLSRPDNLAPGQGDVTDDINIIDLGAFEYQSAYYDFSRYLELKRIADPDILPVNWEADSHDFYEEDGLHQVELLEIRNNHSIFETSFPRQFPYYRPHLYFNLNENTIDSDRFNIILLRIFSPLRKDNALHFTFHDSEGNSYSTSSIDVSNRWNIKKVNMDELSPDWAGKTITRLGIRFTFTDEFRRGDFPDSHFEFEFRIDWLKLFTDSQRTSIEPAQWSLYH